MSAEFTVREVGAALERVHQGRAEGPFRRVAIDSRRILPGDLFVAIRGDRFDGNAYVVEAVRKGAIGAIVSDPALPAAAGAAPAYGHARAAYIRVPVEFTLRRS